MFSGQLIGFQACLPYRWRHAQRTFGRLDQLHALVSAHPHTAPHHTTTKQVAATHSPVTHQAMHGTPEATYHRLHVHLTNEVSGAQVEWASLADESAVPKVPVTGGSIADALLSGSADGAELVKVQPIQFHFHTVSEHTVEGVFVRTPGPRAVLLVLAAVLTVQ
jgi:hypothetical protein